MPRGITRKVPSRQQRAGWRSQDNMRLGAAVQQLTMPEYARYQELLEEARWPASTIDRAAILDRAKADVRGEARAEKEAQKTEEEHRYELWGER